MGRYKCAYNCENTNESDVKYFKFPLYNQRKLKKWLANMNWKDWTPSRFSVLCSKHFEERYIERTGKSVTLKEDAVPTLFQSPVEKRKASVSPRSRRHKQSATKPSQASPAEPQVTTTTTTTTTTTLGAPDDHQPDQTEDEPDGDKDSPKKPDKWRIIVDEGLMKIDSFPHFFHGDYCVPQRDIQWAPDSHPTMDSKGPENVIKVSEPWQWLGLDVRGPLPQTPSRNKYILTLTDYYSKWVEAVPIESCVPSTVAKQVTDIIRHFGFPLRILSRLPHDIIHKINRELKDQLTVTIALLVHHQQTGTADLTTQQLIDRMVSDLVEEHAANWDVYLPAKVFSLCFQEHSETKERPFSVLCCKGAEPVQTPRGLDFVHSKIGESTFVICHS